MKKENGILVSAKQVTFPFTYILKCDCTPSIFCLVYNGVHLFFFISRTFLRSHLFRGLFKYSPFKWRKPFETNGCQVCSWIKAHWASCPQCYLPLEAKLVANWRKKSWDSNLRVLVKLGIQIPFIHHIHILVVHYSHLQPQWWVIQNDWVFQFIKVAMIRLCHKKESRPPFKGIFSHNWQFTYLLFTTLCMWTRIPANWRLWKPLQHKKDRRKTCLLLMWCYYCYSIHPFSLTA